MTQLGIVNLQHRQGLGSPHDSFPDRSTQHLPRSPPWSARCTSATSSTASYPWRELFALLAAQHYEGFTLAEIPESITPARKFRMLLHTNPTRERGECLGTRAGALEDM